MTDRERLERQLPIPSEAVFGKLGQATIYVSSQPLYYDENGLFWVWNFERCCYEVKDETELLNGIRNKMTIDTISSKERTEIIAALKQVGRTKKPVPKPKGVIQFTNTLVNPKTKERFEATPEYFLTNPIPYKLGKSNETPVINQLIREWVVKDGVQDESYVKTLYEYIAYALTDDLFLQRIIALTGGGANGKGTFLKLIEKLVGPDNRVNVSLTSLAKNNFATSFLYKKLVALAGEVGYNDLTNTSILKMLSGEDSISYEFKGKNAFTDDNITTFFIATNSLPISPDKTLGFYRRWTITDFPNVFDIDADILCRIPEEEFENLCLKCVDVLNGLYQTKKFTNEGDYDERERKYEERSNPLPSFIDEFCEEIPGEKTILRDFSKELNCWLKTKRLRVMSVKQVGKLLRNLGYDTAKRDIYDEKSGQETSAVVILGLSLHIKTTETTKTTMISTDTIRKPLT